MDKTFNVFPHCRTSQDHPMEQGDLKIHLGGRLAFISKNIIQ